MKKTILLSVLSLSILPNISFADEPNSSTDSQNLRIPDIETDAGYVRTNPGQVTVGSTVRNGVYSLDGSTDF